MVTWILFDQAKVLSSNIFTDRDKYIINDKIFEAEALEQVFYMDEYSKYDLGNISEHELITTFIEKSGLDITEEEYLALFKGSIHPIKGMQEILIELQKNYQLAALINEGTEWAQYIFEGTEFGHFFTHKIVSGTIGLRKPQKEFYEKALHLIDVEPYECIFIDDREENCKGAEECGIKSIVFQNAEQLKEELQKLEIKIN